jgi:hypothetical protein
MRTPLTTRKKVLLAVVVPIEVASAVLAWRDLNRRSDTEVRGRKRTWRAFMLANPGNSLAYWIIGRRGQAGGPAPA